MCSCNTFCWNRQLSSTNLLGTLAFGERDLRYLYYILPDQTVIKQYFDWSHGISRTGVICSCITFGWTR